MNGYYVVLVPRCHSHDLILVIIISAFMLGAFPLFEVTEKANPMREFRVTRCNHFTQKIRVPEGSKTQVSNFTEYDSTHKASLATSQLILCVTQRRANPKSKAVGTEDLTSILCT